jgi:Putative transposase/Transposase zinc-binding domain
VHAHAPPDQGARAAQRPAFEVADIVRASGDAFRATHALTPDQHAVLRDIARCRTAALGGYADVCPECGYTEVGYNSCRNRHCPKCQACAQGRWLAQRLDRMLPVHAFHVVFTLPGGLRTLVLENRELLFNLLFAAAAEALQELGRDPKYLGGDIGLTAVLHTWTRDLRFHPHVHCIVTGGALAPDGSHWIGTRPDFLFPVRVLGALFRGKFLARLEQLYDRGALRLAGPASRLASRPAFTRLRNRLYTTRWVVHAKPPFGGPEEFFRYVGRYTHRVGLSNTRIVALDAQRVVFRTRGDATATLTHTEFLERFVLHVLPKGFTKIRHFGLFAAGNVNSKLMLARQRLADAGVATPAARPTPSDFREWLLALAGIDILHCPRCRVGILVRRPLDPDTASWGSHQARAPPAHAPSVLPIPS